VSGLKVGDKVYTYAGVHTVLAVGLRWVRFLELPDSKLDPTAPQLARMVDRATLEAKGVARTARSGGRPRKVRLCRRGKAWRS
jgi:hypothetical protein